MGRMRRNSQIEVWQWRATAHIGCEVQAQLVQPRKQGGLCKFESTAVCEEPSGCEAPKIGQPLNVRHRI